ncbi:MAG: hypothetical protein DMF53_23230 [Acidobacteria bacterium]|nr:MAG: hypothetical protein DMF53_23230 [Acidobacteriota bacterium]
MRIYLVCFTVLAIMSPLAATAGTCYDQCNINLQNCEYGCVKCDRCESGYDTCINYCNTRDSDGDGVVDSSDNCYQTYNPNQADCDGDGIGDACDSQDNGWNVSQVGARYCAYESALKWNGREIRLYTRNLYQSACTGAVCYKRIQQKTFNCGWYSESEDYDCCKLTICGTTSGPCSPCDDAWYGNCSMGYPYCSF